MKKILNGLMCGMLLGTFVNYADCYEAKIKGRNGYDEKGRYDPSLAYNRKFAISSHTEVADMKNENDDAVKTGLKERLKKDPREELKKETRRFEKNKDGKYVDNYRTICRNALFFARESVERQGKLDDLSEKEAELLAYALEVYLTEKDLKDIILYINMNKDMKDSLRVNILESIDLIKTITKTEIGKVEKTLKSALKKAEKFEKDNEKTIKLIRGMQNRTK